MKNVRAGGICVNDTIVHAGGEYQYCVCLVLIEMFLLAFMCIVTIIIQQTHRTFDLGWKTFLINFVFGFMLFLRI